MSRPSFTHWGIVPVLLTVLACDPGRTNGAPTSHVFVLRGGAQLFAGADQMEAALRANGDEVQVVNHRDWDDVRDGILSRSMRGGFHGPIVLVGYSMGGIGVVRIAEDLRARGVAVDLLMLVETVRPGLTIPANVRRCVNIYRTYGVFGGRVERQNPATDLVNYNAKGPAAGGAFGNATHLTITGTPGFRNLLLAEIGAAEARFSPPVVTSASAFPHHHHAVAPAQNPAPPASHAPLLPAAPVKLERPSAPRIDQTADDVNRVDDDRPRSTRSSMEDFHYLR